MIHAPDRSLIGFGMTSTKPWQSQRGRQEVGNSTELKIQHATEKKSLRNFRLGIGNNNSKSQITGITGSFTLYDIGPAQLALSVRAVNVGIPAGPVTGEAHPTGGLANELIVFKNLVDTTKPVSVLVPPATASAVAVAGNAGNGTIGAVTVNGAASGAYRLELTSATAFTVTAPAPGSAVVGSGTVGTLFNAGGLSFTVTAGSQAFVADDSFTITVGAGSEAEAGVDFIITPYGIQLPAGSTIGERGIVADYARLEATRSEILMAAATEQSMHFAGLNDAQDGLVYDYTLHRVKFDDISEISLNGADYVALNVTFELLPDYTRVSTPADPLSQFYTRREAVKAA